MKDITITVKGDEKEAKVVKEAIESIIKLFMMKDSLREKNFIIETSSTDSIAMEESIPIIPSTPATISVDENSEKLKIFESSLLEHTRSERYSPYQSLRGRKYSPNTLKFIEKMIDPNRSITRTTPTEETFVSVPGAELDYKVSNFGNFISNTRFDRINSFRLGKKLKIAANGNIGLTINGEQISFSAAKIILATFTGKWGDGVGYRDGNKKNLNLSNLYWVGAVKDQSKINGG